MIKRLASFALIVLGAVVSIFSLVADPIGFGAAPTMVGWKQLTGAVVGIFMGIFGLWLSNAQSESKSKAEK